MIIIKLSLKKKFETKRSFKLELIVEWVKKSEEEKQQASELANKRQKWNTRLFIHIKNEQTFQTTTKSTKKTPITSTRKARTIRKKVTKQRRIKELYEISLFWKFFVDVLHK